jgi:hypothetical protein
VAVAGGELVGVLLGVGVVVQVVRIIRVVIRSTKIRLELLIWNL